MIEIQSILKGHSPEIALAILLLRIKAGTASIDDLKIFLAGTSIDISAFIKLLEAHQIESIVYSTKAFKLIDRGEESFKRFTNRVAYKSRFNMILLEELVSLHKILQAHKFAVLFYKGVLLSEILFDDYTSRTTADIDVLIHAKDFPAIRELLISTGYSEDYFYPVEYAGYYLSINREASFRKKNAANADIIIELQWAPLPAIFGQAYNNDYFFMHAHQIQLFGEKVNVTNPEQHFVMLLIHHGVGDLWRNLKHVFDIAVFAHRYRDTMDWKEIENQVAERRIIRSAKVGINLSNLLFGIPVKMLTESSKEEKPTNAVLQSLLQYPLIAKKKKSLANMRRQLLLCDTTMDQVALLKGYLKTAWMPSMIDLENEHFSPAFFPLYYVTKRFRVLYKKKNAN